MTDGGSNAAVAVAPRANPELVGHAEAEALFLDCWRRDRLAHAWLITGPRGVGKATLSYRLARMLLGAGEEVPPDHPVFRRVAAGSHPDLLSVERSVGEDSRAKLRSEIVIEDARKVARFLHLTPSEAGWRVVIIDGADEMNRNAANAVLKIVEEPPAKALILMTCHARYRVLPTIRSRCRTLALRPLDVSLVGDWLCRRRPELAADQGSALARLAKGRPGAALTLADGGGLALYEELLELFGQLPNLEIPAVHEFCERLTRRGAEETYRMFLNMLTECLARFIRSIAGGNHSDAIVAKEAAVGDRLAKLAGLDQWLDVWDKTLRLAGQVDGINLDRKQIALSLFNSIEAVARR